MTDVMAWAALVAMPGLYHFVVRIALRAVQMAGGR